ncbi:MAG: hypothetical protein KAI66_27195, partial [Lentisphaeria bacterium]|nr:hypothetical protein [Lentisphaeria bacterium]
SHEATCQLVAQQACPRVEQEVDVLLTSSGGYPLDATFYQCVKGMASCLPAVRKGGVVISVGSCSEGIGGDEYQSILREYSGRWREFLRHLQSNDTTTKDQWEFQMQTKVLEHVGDDNLIFVTSGLSSSELAAISVNGVHAPEDRIQENVQEIVDRFVREGRSMAVIPEGPYCAPNAGD